MRVNNCAPHGKKILRKTNSIQTTKSSRVSITVLLTDFDSIALSIGRGDWHPVLQFSLSSHLLETCWRKLDEGFCLYNKRNLREWRGRCYRHSMLVHHNYCRSTNEDREASESWGQGWTQNSPVTSLHLMLWSSYRKGTIRFSILAKFLDYVLRLPTNCMRTQENKPEQESLKDTLSAQEKEGVQGRPSWVVPKI